MEELPPRPNRPIIPNIEAITKDPFLKMVMAKHYNSPNLDQYKSAFTDETDEIVDSLHDMGFQIVRNEDQLNILNATVITPTTTTSGDEVAISSDSGKTSNSSSEQ